MKATPEHHRVIPILLIAVTAALSTACEKRGPAEDAGETIDKQIEQTREAAE